MKRSALFLICLYFLCSWSAFAQWQKPYFTRLSTNEGLSQSTVHSVLRDSRGFMWFGTNEGLNRYDGYKFSVYKHYPQDKTSLGNDIVFDLLEDKTGTIWVATGNGLDKFDRSSHSFIHYFEKDPQLIIRDIFQDSRQRIWLGTTSGLYLLNIKTNSFIRYKHKDTSNSLSHDYVMEIAEDKAGAIWIATQDGLNRLNPETGHFDHFFHSPANPASIGSNWTRALLLDRKNNLWVGTLGAGIARYDPATNSFINFKHNPTISTSIGHNDVLSLLEDDRGNIWVGTENGGISVYHPGSFSFSTFGFDPTDAHSLSNNSVYSLYKDGNGNIWAGTYSGGVNLFSKFGRKFQLYRNMPTQNSLSNNIVLSIKGDSGSHVWLGTDGGGLNLFDRRTNTFTVFRHQSSTANSPASDFIINVVNVQKDLLALGFHRSGLDLFDTKKRVFTHYTPAKDNPNKVPTSSINSLFRDRETNLWLGTWARGICFYDRKSKRVTQFLHNENDPKSLCDDNLNAIYEDEQGRIWLGTENGLDRLDRTTNTFTHFKHDPRNSQTISSNTVNCVVSAGKNHLWIGTTGGLCLLNTKTNHVQMITEKEGLPNNVINAIIYDTRGNLWVSTNKGIANYNPHTKVIRNYGILDGLQGNEFKVGAVYRAADGTLFFGGSDGLNVFHPDSIQDNPYIPPVYITDFQIFNKPVLVGDANSLLTKHISETSDITLNHDQGVFSLEFAALNYTLPEKNQYAYKLEGFDKDWNYVGNKRSATYTNLDPGEYTFRVKGSNNDGLWNEKGVAMNIKILPPFWETWWFRLAIAVLILGSAYAFYQFRVKTIKAQKWALERIVEERTERLHQEQILNKMKSQFVSTASHEFRTPLATIQSSVDLVGMYVDLPAERGKPQIQKHLRVVEKEISKFTDLLNDVLTIEKMDAGKMLFCPEPTDVTAVCEDVISTHFQMRSDHRSVDVSVVGAPRPVLLDQKLIAQALVNLLSNAFKFSDTNPAVHITFDEKLLLLSVADQGMGIPQRDLPHLFETFFRAGNVSAIQGTGLGLFIARRSVELHGGSIQVDSQEDKGTTFTITLPTEPC